MSTGVADDVMSAAVSVPLPLDHPTGLGAHAIDLLPGASDVEHEDAIRKQRVRRKRSVDFAFMVRRSSRLAAKEVPQFETMLLKAKAAKASRFDLARGSPHFHAAAVVAGFTGNSDPGPIPLPRLRELAAVCCVDPDAVDDAAPVPSSST
jgi:hypothetical protein